MSLPFDCWVLCWCSLRLSGKHAEGLSRYTGSLVRSCVLYFVGRSDPMEARMYDDDGDT